MRALVTGAGAPGILGTISSLRSNPDNEEVYIVTVDIQDLPVGKAFADAFYKIPAPESDDYREVLLKICLEERIEVVVPQTTREIQVLSNEKDFFFENGIAIAISDFEAIQRANDKFNILEDCKRLGVPFPEYKLVSNKDDLVKAIHDFGFPANNVVVKPRLSNGMRGVRVITNEGFTLEEYLNNKPDSLRIPFDLFMKYFDDDFPELIVSEYLPGAEYTIDVLNTGEDLVVVPRKRDVIRSGISFVTTVDLERADLIEYSKKLGQELGLDYCFGFQFKLDKDGVPKILESNPRVQGTMITSTHAGCNMIYYAAKKALNKSIPVEYDLCDKVCFKRAWAGVSFNPEQNEVGRI